MKNDMIALARRRVIEGHKIVERQRQLVKELELSGHNAADAKFTLGLFERTLEIFEDHLRELTEQSKR
jgi:hypothetical protein